MPLTITSSSTPDTLGDTVFSNVSNERALSHTKPTNSPSPSGDSRTRLPDDSTVTADPVTPTAPVLATLTVPALTLSSSPALTAMPSPASATMRPPDTTRASDTDDTESASPERSHMPPADTLTPSDT